MRSFPGAWLAVQPAHLPHYSHTAVAVGGVIVLTIVVLEAVVALAAAVTWSRRADDEPGDESALASAPPDHRPAPTRRERYGTQGRISPCRRTR
jgi:hypothetical protein